MKEKVGKVGATIKKPPSKKLYINGKNLYESLVAFYAAIEVSTKNSQKRPEIPKYIGECILHIANNLSTKIDFVQLSFRDEMVGDAIEKMVEAVQLQKFNPDISKNPFAYFTQISWNSFLQRIAAEKKQMYVKHKNIQNMEIDFSEDMLKLSDNEFHNKVLENFETPKIREPGYVPHRNLSYERNRNPKKKEKKKENEE